MNTATVNQVNQLLDLAWQRCDTTEDELRDYETRFSSMTFIQAGDLIDTWRVLPVLKSTTRPVDPVTTAVPVTTSVPTPTTPAPTTAPPIARLMTAKYNSQCPVCHDAIYTGQQIYYVRGLQATHQACGPPIPAMPNTANRRVRHLPTQPTPAPPKYLCHTCHVEFATMQARASHEQTAHNQSWNPVATPPKPAAPPIPLPDKGYYAALVPVDGVSIMRFYRVTERQIDRWNKTKVKVFLRQSGDNWVSIETMERTIALAIINAAPILAKEAYGKLIGCCGNCGKSLTDEISRARGIGPECMKRFPGRYQ